MTRRRVRVAVNLLWLVPGVVGGSEGYATRLLRAFAARRAAGIDDGVDLALVALPAFADAHPDLAAAFTTKLAPLPPGRHVIQRVVAESSWLPAVLRAWKPDVTHHVGGVIPPGCRGRSVVTVHDLQYLHFPEYFSRTKLGYLRTSMGRTVQQADVVCAVSAFTGQDVADRFGLDRGRVSVVHPVVSADPPPTTGADLDRVRARYRLERRWLLYPAAWYPHKNHLMLVDAFAALTRRLPDVDLVLTGATGAGAWGSAASTADLVEQAIGRHRLRDRVHVLGHVSGSDYRALLAGAEAMVFPSTFEGFGLPVVEAMSAGVPVLAGDAAALPEVVGDAAPLLPTGSPDAWAQALHELLTDRAHATELARRGRARALELAGDTPVDAQVGAYRRAAGLP